MKGPLSIGLFTSRRVVSELTGSQATCGSWLLGSCRCGFGPSVRRPGGRARRRVRRVVRVGVELPRHDGEVHGVVTDDDAVLELRVRRRACHAQAHVPKRRRHTWEVLSKHFKTLHMKLAMFT
jgi:hypothetical protein